MPERTPRERSRRLERIAPPAAGRRGGAGRGREARAWIVEDDLPRPTPVGRAEIDVLETFLGRQIDNLLGEVAGQAAKPGEAPDKSA